MLLGATSSTRWSDVLCKRVGAPTRMTRIGPGFSQMAGVLGLAPQGFPPHRFCGLRPDTPLVGFEFHIQHKPPPVRRCLILLRFFLSPALNFRMQPA